MADKDLLDIIAEMLRKQDQHSELINKLNNNIIGTNNKLDETNRHVLETNSRLLGINEKINETNSILKDFMGVSIKQWEEQQKFNERLFNKVEGIEKQLEKIADLEDRVKRIENILFKAS